MSGASHHVRPVASPRPRVATQVALTLLAAALTGAIVLVTSALVARWGA